MTTIQNLSQHVIQREKEKLKEKLNTNRTTIQRDTENQKEQLLNEMETKKEHIRSSKQHELNISSNSIELQKRDQILKIKQEIIKEYISDVNDEMIKLSNQQLVHFIQSVISQFDASSSLDLILGETTKNQLNETTFDLPSYVTISNEIVEREAGFILREGSHRYNYLFKDLVSSRQKELQQLIVTHVFTD